MFGLGYNLFKNANLESNEPMKHLKPWDDTGKL